MKRWLLAAGVLALLAVSLNSSLAWAQPAGGKPSAARPAAISFSATLRIGQDGETPEEAVIASGRFNLSGEFEMQLAIPEDNEYIALVYVGERFYINTGDGSWQYLDAEDLPGGGARRPGAAG